MSWKEVGVKDYLQTPISIFNIATGGRGIPLPSAIMMWGVKDSGKTTIAQTIPMWYLKQFPNSKCLYIDTELKIDKIRFADFLLSNNINPDKVKIVQSSYIEDVFGIILNEIRDSKVLGEQVVVVIDSIADLALKPKLDKKGGEKKDKEGYSGAKIVVEISKQLQKLINEIVGTKSLIIIVNQARQILSTSKGYQYKGGEYLKHKLPLIIRFKVNKKVAEKIGDIELEKGIVSEFTVEKNQLFIPRIQGWVYIDNDKGVDVLFSNLENLLKYGIIKKSGSWKYVRVGNKEYKWQSSKDFIKLINEVPEFITVLNYALYKFFYDKYDSNTVKVKLIDVINEYEERLGISKTELPEGAKRLKEVVE